MTLTQNLSTSTTTISAFIVRKIVAGTLGTAVIIALGFLVATQASNAVDLVSSMTLTSYIVVLAVAIGALSMLGVRESVREGKKQQFDIR